MSLLLIVSTLIVQSHAEAQPQAIAFTNVNVVPFDRERILAGQTVIVRDGRIAEIGSADKTKVPAGALQIDGRGKYLMPGLADMHVHLFPGAGAPDDLASQQLQLFLANGVTTIRNMIGKPEHLLLRDGVAKGELLGPTIYTAGPPLLGNNVPTPEAAERIVAEEKKAGYDLLKVHEGLSPETYAAIVATANRVGIPFAGHVTATVGLKRALDAHQTSIEHLDGYLQAMVADDSPVKPTGSQVVVVRGRWLPESELRKMLENVARLNASTTQGSTAKADFSGAWSLDKRNSEGLPPGMDQLMTVAVSGDKLSLETKLITEQGEQVVADRYMLNGQEVEFSPKTPDGKTGKGKRTAKLNGNSIDVSEQVTFDAPEGAVTIQTTRKWTLSPDGKTLKIDMTIDGPNGKQPLKRTFIKK